MTIAGSVRLVLGVLLLFFTAACAMRAPAPPPMATRDEVSELAQALKALGPSVDAAEAERLAEIAYSHTRDLAVAYEIEDPPLIHNMKVNMGIKPRGLCKDWADDMEARLRQEGFESFTLHRAIANHDKPFRIEHSTVIVSARGADMFDGIVIDPWRLGGVLWWGKVSEDPDYEWVPREEVFAYKRRLMRHQEIMAAQERR